MGCLLFSARLLADGPGLGNLTYNSGELLSTLGQFNATNGAPRGHGFVAMHKGYLVVPFSADQGGGNGSGGFAFYDVGNPRAPLLKFTTEGNTAYTSTASPNYVGNLREPHGYSFTRFGGKDYVCFTTNISSANASGLQVWDFTDMDTPAPTRVSQIGLTGLNGGDYAPTPWWVFWQGGRYAYVASTSRGLNIVDATDPANPVVLRNLSPAELGFGTNAINTVFAVGNLLVMTGSQPSTDEPLTGLATYDISDPVNPVLLDFESDLVGYSAMVNGDRVLGARDPARIWSIADPAAITLLGTGPNVADKGGYGAVQDNFFHYGSSSHYVKLNISSTPFTVAAQNRPPNLNSADWDFATPLGNLIFQGNDHSPSLLVVHQLAPDTTGPVVNMVSPKADSVNRALTSRVGVTFTDQIDLRSVDSSTFIVRAAGGSALPGRYSVQTGIVNFWPDSPLAPNTIYEVRLPAGGVKDIVGNGLATEFVSFFSTGETISPFTVQGQTAGPVTPGTAATFNATGSGQGALLYSWSFGDGTPQTIPSPNPNATHSYAAPGHYAVTVTLTNGSQTASASLTQTVHRAISPTAPTSSSTIMFDSATSRVWCVNSDANTVTALNGTTFAKLFEIPVGRKPRTLARAPSGAIWVVNQDDASISVLNPTTGSVTGIIPLPSASLPYGLAFSPNGSAAFVATEGTGAVLRLDPTTGASLASLTFGAPLRSLAISGDSTRLFATRFISPDSGGEVFEVNPETLAWVRTISLGKSPGPDTEAAGRGIPNYVSGAAISPDGQRLWLPSKKDNIDRGLSRDGLALNFESTVRTISSQVDLTTNTEDLAARIDFNDRDMAQAVAFTPLGDYALVALQGSNSVDIVDAYSRVVISALEDVGRAPQGLVFNPAGTRLFVQNFMSRTVSVHDTSGLVNSSTSAAPLLAQVTTVTTEPLSPTVLLGKQIFYNADDPRMNHDGYISCASCHLDGGADGRVWDFTDRGEGLRRTVILNGRGGMAQGRVHWSANFDEIQDFEHDIRGPFDGEGFMSDAQFNTGTRNQTLGDPKTGLSPELDALAAYLASLDTVPPSPFRQPNGALTPDAVAGRVLFTELSCFSCHAGNSFTDSTRALLHNVGTLKASSGNRLGQTLPGIDSPTLKGVWQAARYLHDGSASTLLDVLTTANPNGFHGATQSLTSNQRQQLAAYLQQIDEREVSPSIGSAATLLAPAHGTTVLIGSTVKSAVAIQDGQGPVSRVEFFRNGISLSQDTTAPYEATWVAATPGVQVFSARIVFSSGVTTQTHESSVTVTTAAGSPVRINFQTAAAAVPTGYLPDSGSTFGSRGNGHSYGWNVSTTNGSRERAASSHPEQRYRTLCHMRSNSNNNTAATWEIALPSGTYEIFAVFGDADFLNQTHHINIEGITVTDATPGTSEFDEFTVQRTVTDGRLTIRPGTGASNSKICFIDITPVQGTSVSIASLAAATVERGTAPGIFRISRDGSTAAPLSVKLSFTGDAEAGLDYSAVASTQEIPAGESFLDVPISPIIDNTAEGPESVALSLRPDSAYVPGSASSAVVTINDAPLDSWKRSRFTAVQRVTPAISSDLADPNANGFANLLEYALGNDPLGSNAPDLPEVGTDQAGRLTLSFVRPLSASDINYFLEGADTLSGPWFTDPAHVAVTLSNNPDGVTQSVTGTWLGAEPRGFLRLQVTRP